MGDGKKEVNDGVRKAETVSKTGKIEKCRIFRKKG